MEKVNYKSPVQRQFITGNLKSISRAGLDPRKPDSVILVVEVADQQIGVRLECKDDVNEVIRCLSVARDDIWPEN